MTTSSLLRISLLTAAIGAALSAQAVSIGLTSAGTTLDNGFTNDESVLLQVGGFGPLATLHTDLVANANTLGGIWSGTGTYTGAGGTLDFEFDLAAGTVNTTVSYSGAWTMTGGTGTYAGKTGQGTLTINFVTPTTTSDVFTTFSGDLEAVPEPASMAVLGLGTAALLRRRRKA
ncbi:PEP-CTERM sorting domain-containing protein [bacterium]|nr:MAG: PEP-CTERM sorting domain-containing protein [bacterium]